MYKTQKIRKHVLVLSYNLVKKHFLSSENIFFLSSKKVPVLGSIFYWEPFSNLTQTLNIFFTKSKFKKHQNKNYITNTKYALYCIPLHGFSKKILFLIFYYLECGRQAIEAIRPLFGPVRTSKNFPPIQKKKTNDIKIIKNYSI